MKWFTKSIKEEIRQDIILIHDNGHDVTLDGVTKKNWEFIKSRLGHNVIYSQENICVNLSRFSIAQIKNKIKGENHGQ